ncbi:FliM/FliN family flagellar motor switch protein [Undibacterium sp. TJN19]|uniref:FliM/FliN family flagellar motor switch protein n=1 Tax=Undibacterium sp. TJN19 TaxID=3413055 RepID=UPI003BF34681
MNSSTHTIELSELNTHAPGPSLLDGNLNVVQSVKVKLSIRVGETEVSIGELMNMRENHILKLSTSIDTPVDVLLEGNVVARGVLVAVDDNFGVQISELPQAGKV